MLQVAILCDNKNMYIHSIYESIFKQVIIKYYYLYLSESGSDWFEFEFDQELSAVKQKSSVEQIGEAQHCRSPVRWRRDVEDAFAFAEAFVAREVLTVDECDGKVDSARETASDVG